MEERLVLVIFIQFLYTVFSFCIQNLKYHILKTLFPKTLFCCFSFSISNLYTFVLATECSTKCYNGGSCKQNGSCDCPKGYKGKQCQKGSTFRILSSSQNYNFYGHFFFRIINEKSDYFYLRYEKFSFSAICSPRCKNGGKCVRPGVCSCPRGFRKPTCKGEKLYHVQNWSMSWF